LCVGLIQIARFCARVRDRVNLGCPTN
jgi:hypothetical protein